VPQPRHDRASQKPPESGRAVPLVETYRKMFEAVRADTPELLDAVFRLRYQVYCVENTFLDVADNPGGLETDRHDKHSLQALLRHRASGAIVGTTRLVLPKLGSVSGRLPLFEVCPEAEALLPAGSTAEFSRFAVSKAFRRRAGDALYGRAYDEEELLRDGRRVIPHITLGLMAIALQLARDHGIDHVCAIMEPALLRLLGRFGIRFVPIGPMLDYHGWRQPCYSEIGEILANIEVERPEVWDVITDCGRYWPSTVAAPRRSRREAVVEEMA
jgi:N-acyl amino acid synthase of PEP-CTERM/exosortase system